MRNKFLNTGQSGYHPLKKLKVCFSGLRYAVLYDFSVAYKVILSVLVMTICFYFRQWVDFISAFAATGLMLICEMFNTCVEAICDFMETRQNEKIRVIKDIAAAATGISILIWAVVMITELNNLWSFVL
ncbi:diacylglycerol kinase [Methylomonas methanica]|jgi:diacylglycerol kinase (ATP)|uniref:Diacylglycerol kinase n=1 Tax=Methylomonas methanica TaxID=421 RepID=A0A177MEU0_METMH|nr:diacylglycerol kinase [Methylomonas methanica]OAI03843.1 diacylglycerol kinase [Methylomonas methanica]